MPPPYPSRRPAAQRLSKARVTQAAARQRARDELYARTLIYGPFPESGTPPYLPDGVDEVLLRDRVVAPCECGAARVAHVGKTNTGGYRANGCSKYRADVVEGLIEQAWADRDTGFAEDLRRDEARERANGRPASAGLSIRVTDVGSCKRAVYYRNLPKLAELHGGEHAERLAAFVRAPEDKRPARMGKVIHDEWQKIQEREYPWREHEIPLEIPGLESHGRPDDYDPLTGRLRQAKSAGNWRWDQVDAEGVAEEWLDAECIYAMVMEQAGYWINELAFTIIKRADGTDATFVFDWDDTLRRRGKRALANLLGLRMMLENGIMPGRDRSGPTTDKICAGCFARRACWDLPAAERRGVTPEAHIILGIDPDTARVEATLRDVYEAITAATRTEGLADTAKATIDGLPVGQYGTMEIVQGNRGRVNHAAMAADVIAQFRQETGHSPVLTDGKLSPSALYDDVVAQYRQATGRDPEVVERRYPRNRPRVKPVSAAARNKAARAEAERPAPSPVGAA